MLSPGFGHECRPVFLHPVERWCALSLGLASGSCVWTAACVRAVAPLCLQAQRPTCASRRPSHPPGPPGSGVPRTSPCVLPAAPLTVFRSLLSWCPFTYLLLWESLFPARPASLLSWWELGQRCVPCALPGVQRPLCVPRVVCRSGDLSAPPRTLFPFMWSPQAFLTGRWPTVASVCPMPGVLEGPWRLCLGGDPQYQSLSLQCL